MDVGYPSLPSFLSLLLSPSLSLFLSLSSLSRSLSFHLGIENRLSRKKSKRTVSIYHQSSLLPFPIIVPSPSFSSPSLSLGLPLSRLSICRSLSHSITLYFYWKTQEKENAFVLERKKESYQYFTIGSRCRWRFSLFLSLFFFVALIIHYDMIGERLILIQCGKAIFLLFSLSLSHFLLPCLSILWPTHESIIVLSRNSRLSWHNRLSSQRTGIAQTDECARARAREREGKICNELSLSFVLMMVKRWCTGGAFANICLLVRDNENNKRVSDRRRGKFRRWNFQH